MDFAIKRGIWFQFYETKRARYNRLEVREIVLLLNGGLDKPPSRLSTLATRVLIALASQNTRPLNRLDFQSTSRVKDSQIARYSALAGEKAAGCAGARPRKRPNERN